MSNDEKLAKAKKWLDINYKSMCSRIDSLITEESAKPTEKKKNSYKITNQIIEIQKTFWENVFKQDKVVITLFTSNIHEYPLEYLK